MFVTVLLGCSCVCIGAMLIFTITKKSKYNMKRTPPGPSGLPFIGQGLSLSVNNAHLTFTQWTKEYGDIFAFTLFGKRVIVLNEPDVIRKAFASSEYSALLNDRPPSFIGEYFADRYKDVLFRADDDICRRLKHLTMKAMYDIEQKSESYKCKMQEEINDYVSVIAASAGSDIDVIAPLDHTFCKMISLMFTGERPSDTEEFLKAIEAFDFHGNAMIMPSTHLLLKNLPCLRFLPGYYGSLCRSMSTDKDQLNKFLVNKMKNVSVSQEKGAEAGECSGILHALNRYKTAETWLTDEFILGIVMDLINTSTLTSRGVVSGFIFLIVHFQEVQRKIYAEICDVIGKERKPRSSDLAEMPYTHACILETLRYQSHLGITATHTCLSQEVMFDGFLIPKGASVYGNQWNVHHDERFWTEPFEFRPERFLQTDGSLLPVDHDNRRRNFMPFGVGGRACMGISMTYNRMFLFATTLIQTHALLPPSNHELPGHHPSKLRPGTVLQAPEFFCKVVPR